MRFKEKRSMKVYAGNDQNYKPVVQIRLQGKWLEEFFTIGEYVNIQCDQANNRLIITKVTD